MKITVLGAAGGIGQPLSLLLKLHPKVHSLALYDVVNAPGVNEDLAHINSDAQAAAFFPTSNDDPSGLDAALLGADIVIIPAGIPRKPGMSRDDLFLVNAAIVLSLAVAIARSAPAAMVLVVTNPVNSTVPIVKNVLVKAGVYDPKRLLGVTTLDVIRANTFMASLFPGQVRPSDLDVRVIGGHSGETIVPIYLVGAAAPFYSRLSQEQRHELTRRLRYAGDAVVQAKDGKGLATLAMAYAAYKLTDSILEALEGNDKVECVFVDLTGDIAGAPAARAKVKGCNFFALPVRFSRTGILAIEHDILDNVERDEQSMLDIAMPELAKNIAKGEAWP